MCGIAGIIRKEPVDEGHLSAVLASLRHRGPDGEGTHFTSHGPWSVAFAHTRLAIIDVEGGSQPMLAAGRELCVAFNGEIYNHLGLRKGLDPGPGGFRTTSDTETLLAQFLSQGVDGFGALDGMFAAAFWDERQGALTLVRDRYGVKPLYYTELSDGGIAFASELTSLIRLPGVSARVSGAALASYLLCDAVPPPGTIFESVSKLPPGHALQWRDGQASAPAPFHRFDFNTQPDLRASTPDALISEFSDRLEETVRRQMLSDVPIGVLLSGGIDSSAVTCLAQRHSRTPIPSFSVGIQEPGFDETEYIHLMARELGTEHSHRDLNDSDLVGLTKQALRALDEPMADPSIVPMYALCEMTSRKVKVALGGDGADEMLAGYPTHWAHRVADWYGLMPGWMKQKAMPALCNLLKTRPGYQSFEWKLKRFFQRWDDDPHRRHLTWMSSVHPMELAEALPEPGDPIDWLLGRLNVEADDALNSILALDFQTYLPDSILTKVDRASMAHSLEVRPVFLDNGLTQWIHGLPASMKLRGRRGKYLFREAMKDVLPRAVIERPKHGFSVPLQRLFMGALKSPIDDVLHDSPLWDGADGPLLNRSTFARWQQEHLGRARDRSKPLWALLVLHEWAVRVL